MSEPSVKTIRLYGHLRKRFGKEYRMVVGSVSEAVHALGCQLPGFREYVGITHGQSGFRVLVGEEPQTVDTLGNPVGVVEVIKIVPVVAGAKSAFGQILTGIAIIAAVYFTGGMAGAGLSMTGTSALSTMAISMGTAMIIGGVASMLATAPNLNGMGDRGAADSPSYAFGGPTVTVGQGHPVPVAYGGPIRVGGAVVSAGIIGESYQQKGFGGEAPDDAGTMGGNGDSIPWLWAIEPAV